MSKRELLKTLHAGWRTLGCPMKRAILPATLDDGIKRIKAAQDLATALQSGELDFEKLLNGVVAEAANGQILKTKVFRSPSYKRRSLRLWMEALREKQ